MIAKIVTHGPTREIALAQLVSALEATEVAGVTTNLSFLTALARHEGFASGAVDTGLIDRDLAALTTPPPLPPKFPPWPRFGAEPRRAPGKPRSLGGLPRLAGLGQRDPFCDIGHG